MGVEKKARKVLHDRTKNQLRTAWSNYKRVIKGLCYRYACRGKRDMVSVYCKKCRKQNVINTLRSRNPIFPYFTKEAIERQRKLVNSIVSSMSRKGLIEFCQKNILKMSVELRSELLGKKFTVERDKVR